MKGGRKTYKKGKAQRNMDMDIKAISGGSPRRHTCKCKICGKTMKKSRRMRR
jgi:hypothetical protein